MQAIRQIVNRKDIKSIFVPEEFGDQVEIIVLPLKKENKFSIESEGILKFQEKTGFTAHILADEKEDVWNEL